MELMVLINTLSNANAAQAAPAEYKYSHQVEDILAYINQNIALGITLEQLAALKGCQAHCSVILSPADANTYKKLGLQLTCEPKYQTNKLYHR